MMRPNLEAERAARGAPSAPTHEAPGAVDSLELERRLADDPPFGSRLSRAGVSFRTFPAPEAALVELCLYDPNDLCKETARIEMEPMRDGSWHCFVPNLPAGSVYGYRLQGPWEPGAHLFFNPQKLQLDPYADHIVVPDAEGKPLASGMRDVRLEQFSPGKWLPPSSGHGEWSFERCDQDTGAFAPKSVVIDHERFDWRGDKSPHIPFDRMVIMEVHVRGATKLHPGVPSDQQGTMQGLVSEASLAEMRGLCNAVELMPLSPGGPDLHLTGGRINAWNYNQLGVYRAPEPFYCCSPDPQAQVDELKEMIRVLHADGFKVILDVVFNHTAEGTESGPMLTLRGYSDDAYRRHEKRIYANFSGCGNTTNFEHQPTLDLLQETLRHWRLNYHVDGFRFDLGAIEGVVRDPESLAYYYRTDAPFSRRLAADPILSECTIIYENWAPEPYPQAIQPGAVPMGVDCTWNGPYRDDMRRFIAGNGVGINHLSDGLCGSPNVYGGHGVPAQSLNFITCHDGFTLRDLVSYHQKHNEANGEDNRDGTNDNYSNNCGVEGPTDDPAILELRGRRMRLGLALTMLSAGTPMIYQPDIVAHTQGGNNNSYCQDSPVFWTNWEGDPTRGALREYLRGLYALREENPGFRAKHYTRYDLAWFGADGHSPDWTQPWIKCLGVRYAGGGKDGADVYTIVNGSGSDVPFTLPVPPSGAGSAVYELLMDTGLEHPFAAADSMPRKSGEQYMLKGSSLAVLRVKPS